MSGSISNPNNITSAEFINSVAPAIDTKHAANTFYSEMAKLIKNMADPTVPLVTSMGVTIAAADKQGFLGTIAFNQEMTMLSNMLENNLNTEAFITKTYSDIDKARGG